MKQIRKYHPLLQTINNILVDLPAPINLSLIWNFGSILGLCLIVQIVTGLLLTIHYTSHATLSFYTVSHITRDVSYGWLLRNLHINGASIFFICIYLHIARGIYFMSYKLKRVWVVGVTIYITIIATAFIGYLLPWGQIRFWGATVITNLFSVLPYVGPTIVQWLWGGFGVRTPTLTRFFTLHFLLPFIITLLVLIHLIYLHQTGSNNPLGINSNSTKTPFHFMYTTKDAIGFLWITLLLVILSTYIPNYLGDPENFIPATHLVTPTHIKPEWYFLWAYAILRSLPNKLGGVIAIFSAVLILYLIPIVRTNRPFNNILLHEIFNWAQLTIIILLTWIGGCPVEPPYIIVGGVLTSIYFISILLLLLI